MTPGREATFEKRAQIVRTCISSGNDYDEMALKYHVSYQLSHTRTLRFERT